MVKANIVLESKREELLAELAAAACRVAGQPGSRGAFIDVELDLWYALQARLSRPSPSTPVGKPSREL